MDNCFVDVIIEFLSVAFHSILFYASVYPANIFETKRIYNIVVQRSSHPEINEYISLCLKSVSECLKSGQLHRVEFTITDCDYKPLLNFVFDFDKMDSYDETADAYLIKTEQNMRAFCLKLATMSHRFKDFPENTSFAIYLHTNESSAIALATNPALEQFPMIETDKHFSENDKILPIQQFCLRQYNIDTYIEIK